MEDESERPLRSNNEARRKSTDRIEENNEEEELSPRTKMPEKKRPSPPKKESPARFRRINLPNILKARSISSRSARSIAKSVRAVVKRKSRHASSPGKQRSASAKAASQAAQPLGMAAAVPPKLLGQRTTLKNVKAYARKCPRPKKPRAEPAPCSAPAPEEQIGTEDTDEELMGDPIDMLSTVDAPVFRRRAADPRVAFAQTILEQGALYVLKKFRRVQRYKAAELTFRAFTENADKNRYIDVRCLDTTRVVLSGRPRDYIHANWMTSFDGRKFICTQAPMDNTLGDFWHMILQEGCRLIIMLCSLVEDDIEKCVPYYPTLVGSSLLVETTTITLLEQNNDGLLAISTFHVKSRGREMQVRHLQYTSWPDHSSPIKTDAALELHREISACRPEHPTLIHCSAGVGRSCTLVGVEMMLERVLKRRFQSGAAIVRTMRRSRAGAVQKAIQFLFMHYVVLDLFCQEGVFSSENSLMTSFRESYETLIIKAEELRKKREEESSQPPKNKLRPKIEQCLT